MKDLDKQVKRHLDAIHDLGGWDRMLDILHIRGIQKHLRDSRIIQGLTQEEVAKRMDISQPAFNELETKRYPDYRLSTMRRWALAVGVQYDISIIPVVTEPVPEEPE